MDWAIKWEDNLDFYYEKVLPRILKKGKRLEDLEPDVEPFSFYIDAFKELSTCRTSGMGIMPIPFTAIVEYAKIYNVSDIDEFVYLIRKMDSRVPKERGNNDNTSKGSSDKS